MGNEDQTTDSAPQPAVRETTQSKAAEAGAAVTQTDSKENDNEDWDQYDRLKLSDAEEDDDEKTEPEQTEPQTLDSAPALAQQGSVVDLLMNGPAGAGDDNEEAET